MELDNHDVVVAEGALSETFLDDDSRGVLQTAGSYVERDAATAGSLCAPRVTDGFALDATRARLLGVAEEAA